MKYIANETHIDVRIESGDTATIRYTDPYGKEHSLTVTAQHLVFLAEHEPSGRAILSSPGIGARFIEP